MSTCLVYLILVVLFEQPLILPFDFFMGVVSMVQLIESSSMKKFQDIKKWAEAFLGRSANDGGTSKKYSKVIR